MAIKLVTIEVSAQAMNFQAAAVVINQLLV